MNSDRSIADWYRIALPLLLLRELSVMPAHGYALIESLRSHGFDVKGAAVYPHLAKLQDENLVDANWDAPATGPARKVLTITPRGTQRLVDLQSRWEQVRGLIDAVSANDEKATNGGTK
ncbi:PadR family transcriptional regulator [Rhodoglobus aureus]|uniref:Transcription regulator PadR N-terminal domain-containing protein n=1 Tax=Rhodoglobus aureus TaxID=191497 RepID=A0ABN1VVH7_9MICO